MKLPRYAYENYQFTIIVILLLVLSGTVSLITMPRSEDPQVTNSGGTVYVVYPGANPMDMEQLIIDPLEEALNELEDIKKINSWMEDGLGVIHCEFTPDTDPDDKYSELTEKVNQVRSELPPDILRIGTEKWAISNVNIIQMALVSDKAAYGELEKEAERLEKAIEKIPGIKKADTWAFPEREVRVALDMDKLAGFRIPLTQILNAIQSANMNIPGGYIDIGSRRFNVQTSGTYDSIADLQRTVIHSDGSQIVFLRDVADVFFTYEDNNYFARTNGKRCVFVAASQKENTNIFTISDALQEAFHTFEQGLPASIELKTVFDQSESVARRLNTFGSNLIQGLLLVSIVVLLGVGLRAAIIVMMAIPVSILIGIGFLDASDFGIEQMSIAGLVIALGLLVDNAIVVTENISRFLRKGFSRKEAATQATGQIGWAIVSATVTTVLAFLPIIMMQNISGDFVRSMPLTVVFTLMASLFLALTLTPFLSGKLLERTNGERTSLFQRGLQYFIEHQYRGLLDFSLRHRIVVLFLAFSLLVGSLCLFPLIGVSFFPKAEKPLLVINVKTPQGSSLDHTNRAVQYVESLLDEEKEVKTYAANIGRGNPRIYYNIIPKRQVSTHGQIIVELTRFNHETTYQLIDRLRDSLASYPGARFDVKELEQGPPVEAPIAIKVIGENLDTLKSLAFDVEEIIRSIPGTVNINNPLETTKADLHIKINRDKAGMLGIPLHEIDRTVRACIAGLIVSKFRDQKGEEFNIVLRLPLNGQKKTDLTDLDRIYVASLAGKQFPLSHVATLQLKTSPLQIHHYDFDRNATVTADMERGYSVDQATTKVIEKLEQFEWPKGYRFYVAGELEKREESFGGMAQAVLIAMIAIFGVLVLQFKSFTQPLIVFSAIPLAIIGSFLALLLTGNSFSFMAFIGLASLVGIVVNNSIILVTYANQLREENHEMIKAVMLAGETRFTPIILTTVTTIGGLLPLTLRGGSIWAPMGWTIIGGLLTSTFLTLVIVPVLYSIFSARQK